MAGSRVRAAAVDHTRHAPHMGISERPAHTFCCHHILHLPRIVHHTARCRDKHHAQADKERTGDKLRYI